MDLNLKAKTALVTGSTDGIGFAIAKALADEGAVVYINGRTEERVQEAIKKLKGNLKPAPFDLSTKEGCSHLIKEIPDVDILINNLGIYEVKPFEEIKDEDWVRFFEVNVLSGIRLSRHYLPKMLKKDAGRIIFVSSESGVNIPKEMIHYGMTKSAQISVSRGLAELTAGTRVTVNTILPGPTYTPGVEAFVKQMAEAKKITENEAEVELFKTERPSSLIKRFASPDEVAPLAAFLASEKAAAINGAALRVEGGIIRSMF